MLVDFQYNTGSKKLIVSYVDNTGTIKLKYYDWEQPTKYVKCADDDPDRDIRYKSWDGFSVKMEGVNHPDRYAVYEFLDSLPQEEQDMIFDFNLPQIYFLDIETEIADGFPEAADIKDDLGNVLKEGAATQVLSISIVYDDKIILMGLKDMPDDMQDRIRTKTNEYFKNDNANYQFRYLKYDCEFDMMYHFFYKMVPKMPLMTGWNFIKYDWVYLVNRARKLTKVINGKQESINPNISSPTKRMNKVFMTDSEMPGHKMIFDYMQLYEICDTSIKVKESSSLDFVSNKLIGVDKIKYTGSLQKLYEDDFETFMYYNAVDSVLVQKIHEKMNYISIIYAISSLTKIRIVDVVSQMNNALASLAITEGVLRNRFRDQDKIVLFKDGEDRGENEGIAGGWVMDPVKGMNKWCVTYDFSSLYPSVQREWYIAPENYIGVRDLNNPGFCDNGAEITDNHVVCVNNVVFNKRNSPTIRMLEDVFADRKKNKKIMMSKKDELNEVLAEIKRLEEEM